MKIRPISPADQPEWVRMRHSLWPEEAEDHQRETAQYFAQADESQMTFVLERLDQRLGGFIEVGQRNYAEGCESLPVAFIEGWYVDTDLRRQGWGTALVRAAESWACDRGFAEICSDTLIENQVSIKAHKAIGYEEVERLVCFHKQLSDTLR